MVTHVTRTIVIFLRVNDLLCSFHLKIIVIYKVQQQRYSKVDATGLQSYFLQFEQIPLTTKFALENSNPLGKSGLGTGKSFIQYVFPHLLHKK